jgi:hypothetical protein
VSDCVLLERMQASDEACAVDVALCEKPYELPSPTILSNFKSDLTVKIRNKMTKKFLPSDLPSKTIRLGAIDPERPIHSHSIIS